LGEITGPKNGTCYLVQGVGWPSIRRLALIFLKRKSEKAPFFPFSTISVFTKFGLTGTGRKTTIVGLFFPGTKLPVGGGTWDLGLPPGWWFFRHYTENPDLPLTPARGSGFPWGVSAARHDVFIPISFKDGQGSFTFFNFSRGAQRGGPIFVFLRPPKGGSIWLEPSLLGGEISHRLQRGSHKQKFLVGARFFHPVGPPPLGVGAGKTRGVI